MEVILVKIPGQLLADWEKRCSFASFLIATKLFYYFKV